MGASVRSTVEHGGSPVSQLGRGGGGEGALAQTRLAVHDHESGAVGAALPGLQDRRELCVASDEAVGPQALDCVRPTTVPRGRRDRGDGERVGEALELERSERLEGVLEPTRRERGDCVGGEDLTGLGSVAQPRRGHHGAPLHVVADVLEIAGPDADTQLDVGPGGHVEGDRRRLQIAGRVDS